MLPKRPANWKGTPPAILPAPNLQASFISKTKTSTKQIFMTVFFPEGVPRPQFPAARPARSIFALPPRRLLLLPGSEPKAGLKFNYKLLFKN
jgi:hypothetical protein